MMINRRNFFLAMPLLLAACVQTQQLNETVASSLRITEVAVATSVERENTALPKGVIVDQVRSDVSGVLKRQNPNGTRPVRLNVNIHQFYIANAAAGALLGSSSSNIGTTMTLVDVKTGESVGEPFKVYGSTEARPTMFGALAIKKPQEELAVISADLAANAMIAIFGE